DCARLVGLAFLPALVALATLLPCAAQPMKVLASPAQVGPTDPEELEVFFDEFFDRQMEISHIPGAVFVLVKDGEIFLTKGYGYANFEESRPVVPDQTLFLPGSVGKLFTALAVMQLVEQGRLSLGSDVNEYLDDFQIPDTYPEPVTVGDLLTHTGGFDERFVGSSATTPEELMPLGQYLAQNMPARTMPPGDNVSYCNHCYALAGYLVEKVTGLSWEQYVDQNILQPLEMSRSTVQQPPPPDLAADLAVGYIYANGEYDQAPYPLMNIAPAGALYATGTDMAHFLIAQLQRGRYGETRILEEATFEDVHEQGFRNHPLLRAYTYGGFSLFSANGQRVLSKGGDVGGFSSLLVLLPDQGIGFFTSFNAAIDPFAGTEPREELLTQFLEHYYPTPEQPVVPQPSPNLARVSGNYRWNRLSRVTAEKALNPLGIMQLRLVPVDDTTLDVSSYVPLIKPARYTEVEPLLFRSLDGTDYISFREDERGHITHMFGRIGEEPATFEKVRWYERDVVQLGLIVLLLLGFLSVLAWPVATLIRRLRKRQTHDPRLARLARWLAIVVGILNLLFVVGFAALLMQGLSGGGPYPPSWFVGLLVIPLLTAALSIVLLVLAVMAWKNQYWSLVGRVHYSLVTVAALVFVWFVNYWNLLGFRL
ncbi:MAG TPA: serine hydrolase domain-containing protein, partial [Anaerolineae bacterium]|nr:serine hydrolase domain-containing protein [Anaerolineae bacterium]